MIPRRLAAIFVGMAALVIVAWALDRWNLHPTAVNQSPSASVDEQRRVSGSNWEDLIPEIRSTLQREFPDERIEWIRPVRVLQKVDVTGDGIEEALVYFGIGGAYTDYTTVMKMENGEPTVARFQERDGRIVVRIFLDGASVRNGAQVTMVPSRNAVYSGRFSTDDFGKLNDCGVEAYQWNGQIEVFEFRESLSKELEQSYCQELRERLEERSGG